MTIFRLIIALLLSVAFNSCSKQSPQLPSNKGLNVDQKANSMLILNKDLAVKEDSAVRVFALKSGNFKKHEIGFWYLIVKSEKRKVIRDSISCKFQYKLKSLSGKEFESGEKQILFGKKQVITGIEEGLKLLKPGETEILIIPWYLGYGMKGNGSVIAPYTSLICEIKMCN